jgi:hypothetical protein
LQHRGLAAMERHLAVDRAAAESRGSEEQE